MPPKKSAHGSRPTVPNVKKQPAQTHVVLTQKQIHQSLLQKLKDQYNKIFGYLDQRKYKEVIEICESILQVAPTHCDAMGLKGYALYFIQPKFHEEMKHYLTNEQLANKAKPLGVQLRSFGLQTIRKATEVANKESHIPYQLLANISKMNSEYQTQNENLKIILSLPSHQNNQSFQRELGNNLMVLGKYDQAYKQMTNPLVTSGDSDQREMYELTAMVNNFLAYEAGQSNELISNEKFNEHIQLALQNHNKIERHEQYNSPGSGAHNLALAEQSQLLLFKLFYYEIEQKISKILESSGQLTQDQISNIKNYLSHLTNTLKEEKMFDKELLYKKVIKLAFRASNLDYDKVVKRDTTNIWTMNEILEIKSENEEIIEQPEQNQIAFDKVFDQADIQLIDEAFQYLFDRNSNDSELFLSYIKMKQLGSSEALELLSKYKARQLPLIHNQLKFCISDDKNSSGLFNFVDSVKNAKTPEIVNIVSKTCRSNAVDFNTNFDAILSKVSETDKQCNLTIGMKLLKNPKDIADLDIQKLLQHQNDTIKASETVNAYIASLDTYDAERLQKNLVRNEDDKDEVALPPVPAFADQEVEDLIAQKREKLQAQVWLLLDAWKGNVKVEVELSKVLMCLDVRDRAPNVRYARALARNGNFRESLKIYQKFVARNDALLYLLEYQELQITLGMLLAVKESENVPQNVIIDVQTTEEAKIAHKCMKFAVCCQILQFMNDQYYYYEELYNQLGIARCQKEVAVRSIQTGSKLLLSRPLVREVIAVLDTVAGELQAAFPDSSSKVPELIQQIITKYQDKYYDLFIAHSRMDPPDYGRVADDDFFLTNVIKQLTMRSKVSWPKYVSQLLRRASNYNAKPLQLSFGGK